MPQIVFCPFTKHNMVEVQIYGVKAKLPFPADLGKQFVSWRAYAYDYDNPHSVNILYIPMHV